MSNHSFRTGRPAADEIPDYVADDVAEVKGDHAPQALHDTRDETVRLFERLDEAEIKDLRYSVGKWTPKEILGHMIDDERIFTYRALGIARGGKEEQPGFDENLYVENANFESRSLPNLLDEYRAVRDATLLFFESLPEEAWDRRGTVNEYEASVRGLAFMIAAHELHHLRVLRDRYLTLIDDRPRNLGSRPGAGPGRPLA